MIGIKAAGLLFMAAAIASWGAWRYQQSNDTPQIPRYHVVGHRYYNVSITYKYKGHIYDSTWVDDCILYQGNTADLDELTQSRWAGFGKRLPDGAGAFFQMRRDICPAGEGGRLIRGDPAAGDPWQYRVGIAGAITPADQKDRNNVPQRIRDYADHHSLEYTAPVVYWLDSAIKPTRLEFCGLLECVTAENAKIKIISVRGGPTNVARPSDPSTEVPALASIASGPQRFVGYACWRIPMSQLRFNENDQADYRRIVNWPVAWSRFAWAVRNINLMNAWTSYSFGMSFAEPVSDYQLSNPIIHGKMEAVLNEGLDCARSGQVVNFSEYHHALADPINMYPIDWKAAVPTKLVLMGDAKLNPGRTYPLDGVVSDSDPIRASALSQAQDGSIYIAEALVLQTMNPPH